MCLGYLAKNNTPYIKEQREYLAWKVLGTTQSFSLTGNACHPKLLQRIYNFCLVHAVTLSFLDVLQSFYSNYISFIGLTY